MSFELSAILSFSIFIAGMIAVFRFSNIGEVYHPFIYLIWIGCINETVSYFLIINHNNSILNSIIYGLCESLLLLWFYYNLGVFKRNIFLYALVFLFVVIWFIESFLSKRFGSNFNSVFSIAYSLSVVLLGINSINKILLREREILKNPAFLICIGIVIFFTYKVVVEMFWLYGLRESKMFRINVLIILLFINLLCNLIYALAILWMKKKQAFTLQF